MVDPDNMAITLKCKPFGRGDQPLRNITLNSENQIQLLNN